MWQTYEASMHISASLIQGTHFVAKNCHEQRRIDPVNLCEMCNANDGIQIMECSCRLSPFL